MYINRIILRDVRNFKNLDITLRNDWTKEHLKSVLFTGPNGSGKSTLLEVIAGLWDSLKDYATFDGYRQPDTSLIGSAGLCAIELCDFSPEINSPIWVFSARNEEYVRELREELPTDMPIIGDFYHERPEMLTKIIPANTEPSRSIAKTIQASHEKLMVGADDAELLPSMIFLPAEMRVILPPKQGEIPQLGPESPYKWLAIYDAQAPWKETIEGMLAHHTVRNPDEINRIIKDANSFLVGKEIYLDTNYLRLMVRIDNIKHHFSELSSGERQAILLLFMVSRWLMPGGIVLIDEPDLHLHVSLQRQLIHRLKKIVEEKNGQLIVTSHSPEMWDDFNLRQRFNLNREAQHVED